MSESLTLILGGGSGGGGDGGNGVIFLFLSTEISSTELSFSLVVFLSFPLQPTVGWRQLLLSMSNCNYLSAFLNVLCPPKLYLEGGVLLHVSGKVSGYFGWKGMPKASPNFLPLVNGSLNDYHHLLRRLVDSIYQTHQLLVSGLLRQWLVSWYLDSLETEVLSLGEILF